MVARRSMALPWRLGSRRRLRRRGQRPIAFSSQSRSAADRRDRIGRTVRRRARRCRLGSTSGTATPATCPSTAVIDDGRVVQGRPSPLPVATLGRAPGTDAAVSARPCWRPTGSRPSTASANTASNTASKADRSSTRFTSVRRAAQYSSARECGMIRRSAGTKPAGPLADTTTPPARSRATRATAKRRQVDTSQQQRDGHHRRRNAFRAILSLPSANNGRQCECAEHGGPVFLQRSAAGQVQQVDRLGRAVAPAAWGGAVASPGLGSAASFASSDSTNWPATSPNLLQHSAAELRQLADDLQVGVDLDPGWSPAREVARYGRRRVAGATRLLALGVDDRAVRVPVLLDETHLASELAAQRPTLTLTLPSDVVTVAAGHLRTRHQRDHLLEVGEHVPRLVHRVR